MFLKLGRRNVSLICLTSLIIALEILPSTTQQLAYRGEIIMAQLASVALISCYLFFRKLQLHEKYVLFRSLITAGVFTGTIFLLFIGQSWPAQVIGIVQEDKLIENLSALLLLTNSVAFILISYYLFRKDTKLRSLLALLVGVVFFFLAMEEISWFQRILEIDSPQFLLEHNQQQELNIHNLNSRLMNSLYYVAGFILLVIIPYFRENIINALRRLNFNGLVPLLPAKWLYLPFALASGFYLPYQILPKPYFLLPKELLAVGIITIILLVHSAWNAYNLQKNIVLVLSLVAIMIITATSLMSLFGEYIYRFNYNGFQEYREFIIALGCAVWGIDVSMRLKLKQNHPE